MAAFQQRRQRPATQIGHLSPSQSSEHLSDLASADEGPVLLFGDASTTTVSSSTSAKDSLAHSSWAVPPTPPVRAQRAQSFLSSTSASSSVPGGARGAGEDSSSLGSPVYLLQGSVLPSHDGSGVFAAGSLVQSAVLPSVYASAVVDFDSASDASDARSVSSVAFDALSNGTSTSERSVASWALTEEAVSTLPSGAARRHASGRGRRTERRSEESGLSLGGAGIWDAVEADAENDDAGSAGFTSGSEGEDNGARRARIAVEEKENDEWALSTLAMSAGLAPPPRSNTTRRRRPPPPSSASLISPILLSSASDTSALRSLSPASGSRISHGQKRRHRRAGARDSATGSQKRSNNGSIVSARPGHVNVLERVLLEEEERARRMREVLERRREEERFRKVEQNVLFGSAVRNYLAIDPAFLDQLASTATPSASALATPTPSRSMSPPRQTLTALACEAELDSLDTIGEAFLRSAGFEMADEDDGAETETEQEHAPEWAHYTAATPPAASLRFQRSATTGLEKKSHSASDLPGLMRLQSLSRDLSVRPTNTLMRRSSSYSSPSSRSPLRALPPPNATDLSYLLHEERILLAPADSGSASAASAWGGDLNSLELAVSYWKRVWRKLRGLGARAAGGAVVEEAQGEEAAGDGGLERRWSVPELAVVRDGVQAGA
ncbi:proteophosphoglycan 5 [Rhodotorula toruloides]|uniref:Proteophosphoglycan 5 n=1 Tax=Rhodotorula toruloides TaxID=5286 RepID=A0A511KK05_RHOTO|nr:proteophosphoglycan 5 [Rhodotorula toruloides]